MGLTKNWELAAGVRAIPYLSIAQRDMEAQLDQHQGLFSFTGRCTP